MPVLSSKYSTEQGDLTDWMSFQPSNLIEEINSSRSPQDKYLKLFT